MDTNTNMTAETMITSEQVGDVAVEMIQARILHTLWIYPKLSMSMLQIGIGTGFPPALWHPALELLIAENKVRRYIVKAVNPQTKREQTYTVIELASQGEPQGLPESVMSHI